MMIKTKIFVFACITLFIFLHVNKANGQEPELSSPKAVHIIVILDTSDRISEDKNPGQVERDKEIVNSIVGIFEELVVNHFRNLQMDDRVEHPHRLTFVVPEQPTVPSIPGHITRELTIKDSGGGMDPFIDQMRTLREAVGELYAFVADQNRFTGADIWKWFDDHARHYLFDGFHNCIICLSDGYLNFNSDIEALRLPGTYMQVGQLRDRQNWEREFQSLSPIGEDFGAKSAKFLMIEIALRRNDNDTVEYTKDFDIIKKYWETWLNAMGIMETKFIKKGLNTDILETTIKSFITP